MRALSKRLEGASHARLNILRCRWDAPDFPQFIYAAFIDQQIIEEGWTYDQREVICKSVMQN